MATSFPFGSKATLFGLKKAASLNGKVVDVGKFLEAKGRYNCVVVETGKSLGVLPTNLKPSRGADATAAFSAAAASAAASPSKFAIASQSPVCVVIGMAGSGKTTLMQRLVAHAHSQKWGSYVVNLDPAVMHVPYPINIDVRDTVNYKEVMDKFKLGPNGGIMTSLNLFAAKFDKVVDLMVKASAKAAAAKEKQYMFVDTPGQIEVFTWSASGDIISQMLGGAMPSVIVYVIDTPRTTSPATFMSNMVYACSIFYKFKLPFILVFNKVDVVAHDFAVEWMQDFEAFQDALAEERDEGMTTSLMRSMSLVLDEFYGTLNTVGVSALTGAGMDDFFAAVDKGAEEWRTECLPRMEQLREEQRAKAAAKKLAEIKKLEADLAKTGTGSGSVVIGSRTVGTGVQAGAGAGAGGRGAGEDEDEDEQAEYDSLMSFVKSVAKSREDEEDEARARMTTVGGGGGAAPPPRPPPAVAAAGRGPPGAL